MPVLVLAILLALAGLPAASEPVAGALEAVNSYRAGQGRAALLPSAPLQAVAERHARDMAQRGFFSHTGSDGSSVGARARAVGYRYCFIAENIAMGQRSLGEVMQSWIGSKGHRTNLLHRKARAVGLARAPGNRWVMVLGAPGC